MAEIRVSAHNLEIERGRKNKPKSVPANERFCRNCKTMVEDEVHFISDCPIYESLRNEYLPRRHQNPDAYFINLFKTSDTVKLENLPSLSDALWHWEKKNYIKTNNSFSSLVVIHTHRRQPHHALICVYIYISCMLCIFLNILLFSVYTKTMYCIVWNKLIDWLIDWFVNV